ncbi:MAG: hypothetical protein ACE5HR_01570 [bacterium]
MTIVDLTKIVRKFKERPLPGRKLYIWRGSKGKLLNCLPMHIVRELDILQIAPEGGIDEPIQVRKAVNKAITQKLEEYITDLDGQQILVVSNVYLLARYNVPLSSFYEGYFSDKTMVVLVVPREKVDTNTLPGYVSFEEDATFKYLMEVLPEEHRSNIVEEV